MAISASLEAGKSFSNLEELKSFLKTLEDELNFIVSIVDSETITKASRRVKWVRETGNPELYYKYVVYGCYKSGERESRSSGKRKRPSVKQNCPWKLLVNLQDRGDKKGKELVIKEVNNEHNHDVVHAVVDCYAKKRRSDNEFKEMACVDTASSAGALIRGIKQRQQNLLVQREQSKSKENVYCSYSGSFLVFIEQKLSLNQKSLSSSGASSKISSFQPTIQNQRPPYNDQGKKRVTKIKREGCLPDDEIGTISIRSDAENELERLVSRDIQFVQNPVTEEEFGTLADKIAHQVKQNMGIPEEYTESNSTKDKASLVDAYSEGSAWGPGQCETFTQQPTVNFIGNATMANHHCSVCKTLMFSSEHIPQMVIPCGHTMCKLCSHGKSQCPECNCSVISLTVNIMLQQVIQGYHNHTHGAGSPTKNKSPQRTSSEKNKSNTAYVEDNRRNNSASHRSQLASLHTRQSILSGEHENLMERLENLNKQIKEISYQSKSIASQEHDVRKAIVDLQERLETLETHRIQFETQLTDLYDKKTETQRKIALLSGTLAFLSTEVEKVKLLDEGEQYTE